ncbi:hypothetical protein ACS0TY_036696 [Phlomoides rotata]
METCMNIDDCSSPDTICVQCGDKGFTNAFVYCIKCLQFAVHRYCLSVVPKSLDEFVRWVCSDCEMDVVKHCPKRLEKKHSIDNMTLADRINRTTRKKHELQPSDSPAPVPVPKNISAKSTEVLSTKAALHGIDAINAPSVMTKRSILLKKEVMKKKSIEKEIETPKNRKKRPVAEAIVENEEAKPPQKRKSKHVSNAEAKSDDRKEVMKKKSIEKEIETPTPPRPSLPEHSPKNRKKKPVAEAIVENEEAKPPQKRKSKHVSKAEAESDDNDCEMDVVKHCPKRLKKKLSIDNMTLADRINRTTSKKHELQPSDSPAPVPVLKNISAKSTKVLSTKAALHGIDAINAPFVMTKRSTLLMKEVMKKKSIEKEIETPTPPRPSPPEHPPKNRKKKPVAEAIVENEEAKPPQKRKSKHVSKAEEESDDNCNQVQQQQPPRRVEGGGDRNPRDWTFLDWAPERADKALKSKDYQDSFIEDYLCSSDPSSLDELSAFLAHAVGNVGRSWTKDLHKAAEKQDCYGNLRAAVVLGACSSAFLAKASSQVSSFQTSLLRSSKSALEAKQTAEWEANEAKSEAEEAKKVASEAKKAKEDISSVLERAEKKILVLDGEVKHMDSIVEALTKEKNELKEEVDHLKASTDLDVNYAYVSAYIDVIRVVLKADANTDISGLKADLEEYMSANPMADGTTFDAKDLERKGIQFPANVKVMEPEEGEEEAGGEVEDAGDEAEKDDGTQG